MPTQTHVKALVGAFNKEKALVGAISVIVNLESLHREGYFQALVTAHTKHLENVLCLNFSDQ